MHNPGQEEAFHLLRYKCQDNTIHFHCYRSMHQTHSLESLLMIRNLQFLTMA
uniref:Uncharacterized protein n=1 Tax=Rhizophora mucronata TaxID=61149 RepID=A0A2P2PAJ7_RHIMU